MAQICMLLTSLIAPDPLSFKPDHERYKCNLSEGAKLSIDMMEGMFKVPMKALSPCLVSNIDQHQFYAQEGVDDSRAKAKNKGRVVTSSLERKRKGTNSIYVDSKRADQKFNSGIRVKFSSGSFASGENLPVVMTFTLSL